MIDFELDRLERFCKTMEALIKKYGDGDGKNKADENNHGGAASGHDAGSGSEKRQRRGSVSVRPR